MIVDINLPVIPLRGITVLPGMVIHFDISRRKSIKAVESAMANNQKLFLVAQMDSEVSEPGIDDVYQIGTVAKIKQIIKLPNSLVRVLVEGVEKGFLCKFESEKEYLFGKIQIGFGHIERLPENEERAMVVSLRELLKGYSIANNKVSKDIVKQLLHMDDIVALLDKIATDCPLDYVERQEYLEKDTLKARFIYIGKYLSEGTEIFNIKNDLMQKVKEKVDKNQKDYIIREQLKVLHAELDEQDYESDVDEFRDRLKALTASDEVKKKIGKEINRYNAMSQNSSEGNVVRGYIENCLDLPWDKVSVDNEDINNAIATLDRDHYGLKKVKERIVEYLAVRLATGKATSSIVCLVGPPGTGKTSIAKSIASALNKKYVRICLGGVRDEAEIRGHRKTYVGAMPGRFANALKSAGVKNPLILLDEIDKMSSDYKGDTASAMLEILDSEQNSHFVDHYVEIPIDLSQVLFIATANDLSTIPRPLLDRMEVIEINSYTENEKFHIAKDYLIAKQLKQNGLTSKKMAISDKAIMTIIQSYTREAGVRGLERTIAQLCRKVVKELMVDDKLEASKKMSITDRNIEKYLGKKKYRQDKVNDKDDIGIVRGLAWTSVGGDTLSIEVNTFAGKGELILTGQMGDVMKESARIALTCARSIVSEKPYNIGNEYFENHNLHLHIPEGAVPKDGPSAGITMTTAFVSAFTGKKVRCDVAMTGEITLRGKVLPIGGLKEKLLAAKNAGVKTVIVPDENRKDVEELDAEIIDGMEICYAKSIKQVIDIAFA